MKLFKLLLISLISFFLIECSSTKRFTSKKENSPKDKTEIKSTSAKDNEPKDNLDENISSINIPYSANSLLYKLSKKKIRVELDRSSNLNFNFNTSINIIAGSQNFSIGNKTLSLNLKGDKINTNFSKYPVESIDIYPVEMFNYLNYKNRTYRGFFRIIVENNTLILLNIIDLDDYLKSVVASELDIKLDHNDFEAVKAFSICVRNFSFMKMLRNNKTSDVYSDTRDQVYYGTSVEKDLVNKAVDETSDIVLLYDNLPAQTFYYSSCGGFTEDCGNVFVQKNVPYLVSVKDGNNPNCSISPSFDWTVNITSDQLLNSLKKNSYIGSENYIIKNIDIISRFGSGRVNELNIHLQGSNEKVIKLYGNSIRNILRSSNNRILRSTLFNFEIIKSNNEIQSININGKGFGHGVGLCQWGALNQSKNGKSYNEILYFYYPNTYLQRFK